MQSQVLSHSDTVCYSELSLHCCCLCSFSGSFFYSFLLSHQCFNVNIIENLRHYSIAESFRAVSYCKPQTFLEHLQNNIYCVRKISITINTITQTYILTTHTYSIHTHSPSDQTTSQMESAIRRLQVNICSCYSASTYLTSLYYVSGNPTCLTT